MDVQVVGVIVLQILGFLLTWVSAWYLNLWFPVWVPLKHELNMRNVKCVNDFMWYVHCEVDLKYKLFFVLGYYAIIQGKFCNTYYIWMQRWNLTLIYHVFTYFSHLHWPPGPSQDSWSAFPVYWSCAWLLHLWPWYESSFSRVWNISGTCQGFITCRPLIAMRCGYCRSLPDPWSVEMDWLSRCSWWRASWGGYGFPPWAWPSCCRSCPP